MRSQLEQLVDLDPALSVYDQSEVNVHAQIGQALYRPLQGLLPLVVPGQGRASAQVGALPLAVLNARRSEKKHSVTKNGGKLSDVKRRIDKTDVSTRSKISVPGGLDVASRASSTPSKFSFFCKFQLQQPLLLQDICAEIREMRPLSDF